jgi:hypothetical protein
MKAQMIADCIMLTGWAPTDIFEGDAGECRIFLRTHPLQSKKKYEAK